MCWYNGIGNVEDLPRLVLIDEECENRNVVPDGGVLARNINRKKKPVVSHAYCVHSMKNAKGEIFSSISI